MSTRITKLTSAMGLALGLGLAFTPLGCGGSQEVGMELSHRAGEGPQAPEATVSQITDCVNEAKARLTDTVYAMQFNVEVEESGHAGRVKLKDSSPGERGLESCIARALEGMTSPVPVMRRKVEKMCDDRLVQCLNTRRQPEWNRETFGDDKDCGACFRECKRHKEWPDKKCPPPDYRPN